MAKMSAAVLTKAGNDFEIRSGRFRSGCGTGADPCARVRDLFQRSLCKRQVLAGIDVSTDLGARSCRDDR
jgi:hypothetical protein